MPENQAVLSETLGEIGFITRQASNGLTALQDAEATRPDLSLRDGRMPVMEGLEAMRRMRAIEGLNAVPIIAVSAGAMSDDKARSLAAGATAFLSKPVDHDTLMQTITRHL